VGLIILGFSLTSFSENEQVTNDSLVGLSKEEFNIRIAPLVSQKNDVHANLEIELSELDQMVKNNYISFVKDLIDDCEDKFEDSEISEAEFIKRQTQLEIILSKARSYSKLTYALNKDYKKKFQPFRDMDKLEKRQYKIALRRKRIEKTYETIENTVEEQKK